MYSNHGRQIRLRPFPLGFTLVEMLVAVALVLLMMSLFTVVFQMATDSVSKQRVIAETDQRIRTMTTLLRADFAKTSVRTAFPYFPGEESASTIVPFTGRMGYLYISCNDPASGLDDLVQFTVDARQIRSNTDQSLYYGAARLLWDKIAENAGATIDPALRFHPNQPEADEGDLFPNGTSGSDAAEISIFLRGNNLIRRVMLLRKPLPVSGEDLEIQPKSGFGNPLILGTGNSQSGSGLPEFFLESARNTPQTAFWRFFDFAAVPANRANVPNGLEFIGIDELDNSVLPAGIRPRGLGQPVNRFGFNPVTGLSREHESLASTAHFIGRYLHAETSAAFEADNESFRWPLRVSTIGNPMDITNVVSVSHSTGLVEQFDGPFGRGGDRRVEDVLMSGVTEFRVELWDSRLERWVVPGHQMTRKYYVTGGPYEVKGDYHIERNWQRYSPADPLNPNTISYGPKQIPGATTAPHVFDTWHPNVVFNPNGNTANELAERHAPYYPLKYYPPGQTGSQNRAGTTQVGPAPFTNPDPRSEYDPVAQRNDVVQGFWQPNTPYTLGDVVFAVKPGTSGWDVDNPSATGMPDGVFDWTHDAAGIHRNGLHIAYRCLGRVDGSGPSGNSQPSPGVPAWLAPGLKFTDGELVWEGFNNYVPLRSIRVIVRFIEPNSESPKQLTLVMPMTDPER